MTTPSTRYVSPHLSTTELACVNRSGRVLCHTPPGQVVAPYPPDWLETRGRGLAEVFEAIRHACGDRPIMVRSAYRTLAYNEALRALGLETAPRSQHVEGRALDLATPKGLSSEQFYLAIRELAERLPAIGGIGRYNTFVHVDTRPRPEPLRVAVWGDLWADTRRAL